MHASWSISNSDYVPSINLYKPSINARKTNLSTRLQWPYPSTSCNPWPCRWCCRCTVRTFTGHSQTHFNKCIVVLPCYHIRCLSFWWWASCHVTWKAFTAMMNLNDVYLSWNWIHLRHLRVCWNHAPLYCSKWEAIVSHSLHMTGVPCANLPYRRATRYHRSSLCCNSIIIWFQNTSSTGCELFYATAYHLHEHESKFSQRIKPLAKVLQYRGLVKKHIIPCKKVGCGWDG